MTHLYVHSSQLMSHSYTNKYIKSFLVRIFLCFSILQLFISVLLFIIIISFLYIYKHPVVPLMNTSLGNPALQEKFTQKKCNSVIITHDIQNQYFLFFP